MPRKTIYIDDETEQRLDQLAQFYGDHSKVIRYAVAHLAAFLAQPDAEPDPLVQIERLALQIQGVVQGVWSKQDMEEE